MSRQDFITQLRDLNYEATELPNNRVSFPYTIPVGKFAGQVIQLGFVVADDFPLNPPSGPHLSPHLLPIHSGGDLPHPLGGVHESSPFGSGWQYWSRPFQNWAETDKTVATYMGHIRALFQTQ